MGSQVARCRVGHGSSNSLLRTITHPALFTTLFRPTFATTQLIASDLSFIEILRAVRWPHRFFVFLKSMAMGRWSCHYHNLGGATHSPYKPQPQRYSTFLRCSQIWTNTPKTRRFCIVITIRMKYRSKSFPPPTRSCRQNLSQQGLLRPKDDSVEAEWTG